MAIDESSVAGQLAECVMTWLHGSSCMYLAQSPAALAALAALARVWSRARAGACSLETHASPAHDILQVELVGSIRWRNEDAHRDRRSRLSFDLATLS